MLSFPTLHISVFVLNKQDSLISTWLVGLLILLLKCKHEQIMTAREALLREKG